MWVAAGLKLAQVGIAAFRMVQDSKTESKGGDKRKLAMTFAEQMLDGCSDHEAAGARAVLTGDPDVQEAFEKYADAYVNLQNVIGKKGDARG